MREDKAGHGEVFRRRMPEGAHRYLVTNCSFDGPLDGGLATANMGERKGRRNIKYGRRVLFMGGGLTSAGADG